MDGGDPISVFLCNTMVRMHTIASLWDDALRFYVYLLKDCGFQPNNFTFSPLLKACAAMQALMLGSAIHGQVVVRGFSSDLHIVSALMSVYAKCGCLDDCLHLFEEMPERDVVSWTSVVSACAHDDPVQSLSLFREMQLGNVQPNELAAVSVLTACANLGALNVGLWVHAYLIKARLDMNVRVCTSLVDMYSKCGSIRFAEQVFHWTKGKNVHAWTAMISGYAMQGFGKEALGAFSEMKEENVRPDGLTFVGVLCACSHAGMVDVGREHFSTMTAVYGIVPSLEHYGCMVDLLGRQGMLDEAYNLIQGMPVEPNAIIWRSLLGSCKIHKNVELGEKAAKILFEIEPYYDANYLLLSNLYGSTGRWVDVARIRKIMRERGIKKAPGSSSIEVDGRIHEFVVEDRLHPECDKVYRSLDRMIYRIREGGYVPQTSEVMLNLSDKEKERVLFCHSEKLAVAFGLVSTKQGSVIRVVNNLRMCGDCHNAIKLVSKVFGRELVVRDCFRFHRFANGNCSCNDFW